MKKNQSQRNNVTAESGSKSVLAHRLRDAGVGVERSASVEEGKKACYNHDDKRPPTEIAGNYTIFGGRGLVILDVDVPIDDLPDWVFDLPSTFVVESPHGGHHVYFAVEDDGGISNSETDWGSIRYTGQYTVGPDSTIDHSRCRDGKAGCPGEGIGRYEIGVDKPIPTLSGDHLDNLREACQSDGDEFDEEEEIRDITADEDLINQARDNIRNFQANSTGLAFEDLIDILCGGTGSISGLRHDDDRIDRDKADLEALWMLYGVMRFADESEEDAAELAYAAFTHYCNEEEFLKDGRKRKWLTRPESYRQSRINAAIGGFDMGSWHRWRLRKHENGFDPSNPEHYKGERSYSGIKERLTIAIIDIYSGLLNVEEAESVYNIDLSSIPPSPCHNMGPGGYHGPIAGSSDDCSFPKPKEVKEALVEADRICSERTAENVIRDLRREGRLKWAELEEGVDYRIYPARCQDPPEAELVKTNGEEYVPEESECNPELAEDSEQEVMTDGGTVSAESESSKKLKQIRKARQGNDRSDYEPDVYRCPIDGCERVVIDAPGSLRHHVRQSSDKTHQHRRLNEDLEIETEWSKMDWSPGAPK